MSHENIWYAILRFIVEEKSEAHNVTVDNLCQTPVTPNTQGKNANTILTSEMLNNSDALAETLKILIINDARYCESDKNGAKSDPARNPPVANHTSDREKKTGH